MNDSIEITLLGELSEIPRLKAEVEAFIEPLRVSPEICFELLMALEEAVANIVDHGNLPPEQGRITLKLAKQETAIWMELRDNASPFNPLQNQDPDLDIPFEDREVGGLGIFYLKQMMDSLNYRYDAGENILSMKKIIS